LEYCKYRDAVVCAGAGFSLTNYRFSNSGAFWCGMMYYYFMKAQGKPVRQSVSLPAKTAAQVRSLAKTRRLSSNRMLVELIENGIEAEKRKQQEFFELAERFRNASDPEEVKRLGDKLGRMVFGD
jgi:hypothetical protein